MKEIEEQASFIYNKLLERVSASDGSFHEIASSLLNPSVRRIIGELAGEGKRCPVVKDRVFVKGELTRTIFDEALDLLRNIEMTDDDCRLLNIIEILKDTRKDLSDTDLSFLDLRRIPFINVILGHGEHRVNLRKSMLSPSSFIPYCQIYNVYSVSFSPDGKRYAAGGDSSVHEWDASTGIHLCRYCHESSVYLISYSPDGRQLVSAAGTRSVIEWETDISRPVKSFGETVKTLNTYKNFYSRGLSYSPDGENLLFVRDKKLYEINRETAETVKIYNEHPGGISSLCYSPDGKKVLSGGGKGIIMEWDRETGEYIRSYEGHEDEITSLCYSPDGKKILSGSFDATIKEWNVSDGICFKTYSTPDYYELEITDPKKYLENKDFYEEIGRMRGIYSLSYSPDGKRILSASKDGLLREWLTNGDFLRAYKGHWGHVYSAVYSPDGKRILSGGADASVRLWDVSTGECLRVHELPLYRISSAFYSEDGKKIIALAGKTTIEWDIATGQCCGIYNEVYDKAGSSEISFPREKYTCLCYSHDGKRMATGEHGGTIKEWDIATGECLKTYPGNSNRLPPSFISFISYSPDDMKILASGEFDSYFKEWDTVTGEPIRDYYMPCGLMSLMYNNDGTRILSLGRISGYGRNDNYIREWDVNSGNCLRSFPYVVLPIQGVDFSEVHTDFKINDMEKNTLKLYGAIF